ncbi:MAG: hypothetical protein EP309_01465 [Gammaproteobacteria bacterium]|nr:MAG: hypothetical protein EP309_01465 [Gammaproteobacteria bacterium]
MSTLIIILNDPPYGTERSFNALRLAKALAGKSHSACRRIGIRIGPRPMSHNRHGSPSVGRSSRAKTTSRRATGSWAW